MRSRLLRRFASEKKYEIFTPTDANLLDKKHYNDMNSSTDIHAKIQGLEDTISNGSGAPEEELESVYIIATYLERDKSPSKAKEFIEKYKQHLSDNSVVFQNTEISSVTNALDDILLLLEGSDTTESKETDFSDESSSSSSGVYYNKNKRRSVYDEEKNEPDFIKRLKNTLREQGFFKYDKNDIRYHTEDQIYNPELEGFDPDKFTLSETKYYEKMKEYKEEKGKIKSLIQKLKDEINNINTNKFELKDKEKIVLDRFLRSVLKSLQSDNLQSLPIDLFNNWKNWIINSYQTFGKSESKDPDEKKEEQYISSPVKQIIDSIDQTINDIDWEKIREKPEEKKEANFHKRKILIKKGGI